MPRSCGLRAGILGRDGRRVERLFVTGNYDMEALNYGIGQMVKNLYPDSEERARHVLATAIAANWERIWGEPQFRDGAKLEIEAKLEKGVGKRNSATLPLGLETPTCLRLQISLADGNPDSRVYAYEVVVIGEAGGQKLLKALYAEGAIWE